MTDLTRRNNRALSPNSCKQVLVCSTCQLGMMLTDLCAVYHLSVELATREAEIDEPTAEPGGQRLNPALDVAIFV